MKILLIISLGYVAGGAEQSVQLIKEGMKLNGHEVLVVSSNHPSSMEYYSDVQYPEIDSEDISLYKKFYRHLWSKDAYNAVRKTVKDFAPDVVHFHTMGQLSPSAIAAIGNIPGILTVHGPEEYIKSLLIWSLAPSMFRNQNISKSNLNLKGLAYYFYYKYIQRPIYAAVIKKHIRLLIAPSKYMANVLEYENFGVPIEQVYNGINLPMHNPITEKNKILFVGRLERVKGVDILIEAFKIVSEMTPNSTLTIIGDGTERTSLEASVKACDRELDVIFKGWLDNNQVREAYRLTTVVVIPSIWPENLPTVCIESLSTGRPVIGSRTGGLPELILNGVTGKIVAAGQVAELADAINLQLSETDESLSLKCTKSMSKFKIALFIENLENCYSQLIAGMDS